MKKFIYPVLLSGILLSGCSTLLNNLPGVYSLDIEQGNIINQAMIDQLRPKMTKRQVLYIMGSSMLMDVFHQKRWDYIYSEQAGGEDRKQKRLSLFFKDNVLMSVQGDFKPSNIAVERKSKEITVDVPPRDLEKTLWEKLSTPFETKPVVKSATETVEKTVNQLKKASDTTSKSIVKPVTETTHEVKETVNQLKKASDAITKPSVKPVTETTREVKETVNQLKKTSDAVTKPSVKPVTETTHEIKETVNQLKKASNTATKSIVKPVTETTK